MALIVVAAALGLCSGCGDDQSTPTGATTQQAELPVTLTDQLGRRVELPGVPQRIISITPANTEILFALGLGERVVGVDDTSNYPAEVLDKPRVGAYYPMPDLEKIVSLEPDLVLAGTEQEKEVIPALEERGLKVLGLDAVSVEELLEGITLVGSATGAEARAQALVSDLSARVEAVSGKTVALPETEYPRVLFVVWHDPIYVAGSGTFIADLVAKAGGRNIATDISGFDTMTLEAVLDRDPQIVVANVGHAPGEDATFQWARDEGRLSTISARKDGRVLAIDADIVNRPGPRAIDALEELAHMFHPDLFP